MDASFEIWMMRGLVAVLLTVMGWFVARTIKGQDQEVRTLREEVQEGMTGLTKLMNDIKLDIAKNYVTFDDMRDAIGAERRTKPRL